MLEKVKACESALRLHLFSTSALLCNRMAYLCNVFSLGRRGFLLHRLAQLNLLSPQHPGEVQCLGEATIQLFAFRSFLAFVEIYPVTQLPTGP
jgi:hypothetical protein